MSYIFVGGSQRSGTTLMQAALCSGEETNPHIGESSYLYALLDAYRQGTQHFDDDTIFHFETREKMKDYQSFLIREFLERMQALYAPATSLVLKRPHLTMYFPLLWELIPESKFVIMIRDPRDIVVSMMRVGEKMAAMGQRHPFNSGNLAKIASTIANFYAPTYNLCKKNKNFAKSCLWVRYEEFIANPISSMDRIRTFTGLKLEEFDPENPYRRVHPHKQSVDNESSRVKNWLTSLNNRAISSQKSQNFMDKLTGDQITEIERACGNLITTFKYELVNKKT